MNTQRDKPPRLPNIFQSISDPLYFVTMVTWNRQPLLASADMLSAFTDRANMQASLGITIGRFILMPDHLHVFIAPGRRQILGETVKHLKQSITKSLHAKDSQLRVWQPGFFDHLLRSRESYGEKWLYVVNIPCGPDLFLMRAIGPIKGK